MCLLCERVSQASQDLGSGDRLLWFSSWHHSYELCDLREVTSPLCASVSLSVDWNITSKVGWRTKLVNIDKSACNSAVCVFADAVILADALLSFR